MLTYLKEKQKPKTQTEGLGVMFHMTEAPSELYSTSHEYVHKASPPSLPLPTYT